MSHTALLVSPERGMVIQQHLKVEESVSKKIRQASVKLEFSKFCYISVEVAIRE